MNLMLLGAIAGDTIGSIYEFNPTKDYHFELFDEGMEYTDDTIMTIAIADWLLNASVKGHGTLCEVMRKWGSRYKYPMGGYGGMFASWLSNDRREAYNSWGNGSAMRVSPVGFAFDTLEETLRYAQISAEVTHNHAEGIKGAQATATAIFLARTGKTKEDIRMQLNHMFGYNLDFTCNQIRQTYSFEDSCQKTVPQALVAFFDSKNYEDAIRLTVSLGGDADTMGAITGAVAAAYYKELPKDIIEFTWKKLPEDIREIIVAFEDRFGGHLKQ